MTQMVLRIRQLMCPSHAHSDLQSHFSIVQPCRSISSLPGSTQLGGCATSHQSIFGSFESKLGPYLCFFFHVGIRMPTIPRTVSPVCRLHNIMCILRLQGGRKCVRHGKVKVGYALRSLPRLSAGQRRMVALTLSARPQTELYVIFCPCGHHLFAEEITECYTSTIQFDDDTHRRGNVAFL